MTKQLSRFILGSLCLTLGTAIICGMFFFTIPPENQQVFNTLAGLVIGWGSATVQFYFGSSQGSSDKTEAINSIIHQQKAPLDLTGAELPEN